jgi:hypothetical protein
MPCLDGCFYLQFFMANDIQPPSQPTRATQAGGCRRYTCRFVEVDCERLEQQREAAARFRPRNLSLSNPMLWTLHARSACMQQRSELATIQMAPLTFVGVVVDAVQTTALGTGETRPLGMDEIDARRALRAPTSQPVQPSTDSSRPATACTTRCCQSPCLHRKRWQSVSSTHGEV